MLPSGALLQVILTWSVVVLSIAIGGLLIFSAYARDNVDYRDAISQIEKLLVIRKFNKNKGNASATAALVRMLSSSLYSIFNRLKIDTKD